MSRLYQKICSYFTQDPIASTAIQITSRYVSGVYTSYKNCLLKNHFILPLQEHIVKPSYSGKNIQDRTGLEQVVLKGKDQLGLNGRKVAFLLPEQCQRLFVFSFDSLPKSHKDKALVIQHRVKKQMPMMAEDSRLAFHVVKAAEKERVIASIVKNPVIREYEDLLSRCGIDVGIVANPVISLYHCVDWPEEKNILLINIEADSLGLLAVVSKEIVLARQKGGFLSEDEPDGEAPRIRNIIQEINNTIHFIEDHDHHRIDTIQIRLGFVEGGEKIFNALKDHLEFPVQKIVSTLKLSLSAEDQNILSPLLGQTICQ